jgi:hypothetical protein
VFRHECGATNAPLRVNDCQFALGFRSANLRKNRLKDGGLCYACFEALGLNAERACRETVWLEHRQLLAEREDMEVIIHTIERIHEDRLDFKPAAVNKGG